MVVIAQAVHFVVGNELDAIEVGGVPPATLQLDFQLALVDARFDHARLARSQRPLGLSDAERSLKGGVVKIARPAELRIVLVAHGRVPASEEILVGVEHGRTVEFQRRRRLVGGVGPLGADIGDFGEGVEVLAVRLAAVDGVQLRQELGLVPQFLLEVVATQQLERSFGRLGALLGDEAERFR